MSERGRCCSWRCSGCQVAQAILPLGFQAAGDQPVFGLDRPITAFGSLGFVASALHFQAPLRQSCVVVDLELLDTELQGLDRGGCDRLEKSLGHGSINRQTPDVEAVYPASVHEIFAGAVITGRGIRAYANGGHNGHK